MYRTTKTSLNQSKLSKYTDHSSVVALRTEADDNLPQIFAKLGYDQDFSLVDTKLALGYLTVAIAGFLYYLEKNYKFHDTKLVIGGAIFVYCVICGVMLFLSKGSQYKNNKYIGVKNGKKIAVFTLTESAFSPVYQVKVVFGENYESPVETEIPFIKVFDNFGFLNETEFQAHLEKLVAKKNQ